MYGSTTDSIREKIKDELIDGYELSIAYSAVIHTELCRMAERSFIEKTKESFAFGQQNPTSDLKKSYNDALLYQGSIRLKSLIEARDMQNNRCQYIKDQIPAREEAEIIA